jgi:hypothetical protein
MNETGDDNPQYPNPKQDPEPEHGIADEELEYRDSFLCQKPLWEKEEDDAHREASASSIRHWNDPPLRA